MGWDAAKWQGRDESLGSGAGCHHIVKKHKSICAFFTIYNTIQYNNHMVKRSLIETPLLERPYSSLVASFKKRKKRRNSQNYIVQTVTNGPNDKVVQ